MTRKIAVRLGTDTREGFSPERDEDGNVQDYEVNMPTGMTVNPNHLGTVYELRIINGVLDGSHELD